jgi:TPR repeat protein
MDMAAKGFVKVFDPASHWRYAQYMTPLAISLLLVAVVSSASLSLADSTIDERRAEAERGDPGAQFELGVAYAKGEGVTKDSAEAAKWFLKSAEQGMLSHCWNRTSTRTPQNQNMGRRALRTWWPKPSHR